MMPQQPVTPSSLSAPDPFAYLYARVQKGIKPGLERIHAVWDKVRQTHSQLPQFILVAGTNGKGSTCGFIFQELYRRGYEVGLFSSPHLLELRERFQVNQAFITDVELHQVIAKLTRCAGPDLFSQLTFFEVCTLVALEWFTASQVDFAVLEVGMGGRLDCTNVVCPVLSVVTSIDLDHQQWLGDTLPQIAREKLGIGRPQLPLLWCEPESVLKGLEGVLAEVSGTGVCVHRFQPRRVFQNCMQRNAEIALQAVGLLCLDARPRRVCSFKPVTHIARGQYLSSPYPSLYYTCHNLAACKQMMREVQCSYGDRPLWAVCAPLKDKAYQDILHYVGARVDLLIGYQADHARGLSAAEVTDLPFDWFAHARDAMDYVHAAWSASMQQPRPLLLIFGSFLGLGDWLRVQGKSVQDLLHDHE
ncbi:MAG: hypothetical protein OXT67_03425 [Zetaproteobacteria bacterium]|nr:hypothetical protein [Zetaproteobacteria bacterium]